MTDAEKERTKLLANSLDRASTACLTVGILAPFAAALYNVGNLTLNPSLFLAALLYLGAAYALHRGAMDVLGALDK